MADVLGRDRSRLYPETDNPKLDLLRGLSEALEWSLDTVADYIWAGDHDATPRSTSKDYDTLDQEALAAYQRGDYKRMTELAQEMFVAAKTPDQKARACRLEGNAWDEQARLTESRAAYRRGVKIPGVSKIQHLALEANLANTYYNRWDFAQAIGIAHFVLDRLEEDPPNTPTALECQAFCLYVRGSSLRRMLADKPADAQEIAKRAKMDLEQAEQLYLQLARDTDRQYLGGIAHTCHGALLEVEVELGLRAPQQTVDDILTELSQLDEGNKRPEGDWLESYGWWCDFGANIAFRHLEGRELQQSVAIFSNKLLEITRSFKNWPLLERAVAMQHSLHEQALETAGIDWPHMLDAEDLKLIAGTIGRFPHFRRVGWNLIENGVIIQGSKKRV
ncbi:MAG: hypothetical protein KAY37_17930 [Phycisphaerae bacterium]|nr:hypothetical protein [Phycisphaerae bacterium]